MEDRSVPLTGVNLNPRQVNSGPSVQSGSSEASEKKMIGIPGQPYSGVRSTKLGKNISVISTSEDLTTVPRVTKSIKKSQRAIDMYTTEIVAVPIKTQVLPKLPPLPSAYSQDENLTSKVTEVSKLCEEHVFKQADSVQGILNICSELTGIPGCEKPCDQIIKFCNSLLAETYHHTSSIIGICNGKVPTKFIRKQFNPSKDRPWKVSPHLIPNPSKLDEGNVDKSDTADDDMSDGDSPQTDTDVFEKDLDEDWSEHWAKKRDLRLDSSFLDKDGDDDLNELIENQDEDGHVDLEDGQPDSDTDWEPELKKESRVKRKVKPTSRSLKSKTIKANNPKDRKNEEYSCNLCRQTFKSEDAYVKHQSMHKCDICGIIFFSASSIRDHKRSHSGEKPFVCDFCGACFATNPGLKKHKINLHSEGRPFVCDECPYAGKSRDLLRLHKLIHSKESKYQCETCGAQFKQYSPFAQHLITHKNIWPHHCEYCPKKFKTRQRLRKHLETHSDRYKYQCNICGKRMRQTGNLKTHMRTHTGDKPYVCDKCGQRFAHNVTKKKHMETCYG